MCVRLNWEEYLGFVVVAVVIANESRSLSPFPSISYTDEVYTKKKLNEKTINHHSSAWIFSHISRYIITKANVYDEIYTG